MLSREYEFSENIISGVSAESPKHLSACFVSIGIAEQDFERLTEVIQAINVSMVCLDVANGYTERFVSCLEHIREKFPDKIIMAGNVVTGEMVEELILSGA